MITINPPTPTDTRSALADWLELQVLLERRGISTRATLLSVLDIVEDDAAPATYVDTETDEVLDEAILEEGRSQLADIALEELSYRQQILGNSYPFQVDTRRARLTLNLNGQTPRPGQIVYLFCLLSCAIRERRLHPMTTLSQAEKEIADGFQVCACLAAGGYLNGEVSSFGFPRATGTGFLPALRQTFSRFGMGTVIANEIPPGMPTAVKDGGIDVVAWRNHPDGMPGKMYVIGQCASGINWRGKSVIEYIEQLGAWFTSQPAKHSTPAMFIPFPLHHEIDEPQSSFLEAVKNCFWYEERRFGMIFDRLRITHFANACMEFAPPHRDNVEGSERFDQVATWVENTWETVGATNA